MKTRLRSVEELWEANYGVNQWLTTLHDEFLKGGLGKDFDTIRHWISEFESGVETVIYPSSDTSYIYDGNHRLVAAKLCGLKEIGTIVWS